MMRVAVMTALGWPLLVGAIVITPLNEARAEILRIVAFRPNSVTPLSEMGRAENVFIVGSTPNEHQRSGNSQVSSRTVLDERIESRRFDELTPRNRFGTDKKWLSSVPVRANFTRFSERPINSNAHFPCWGTAAIFPSWLYGEVGNIKCRISVTSGTIFASRKMPIRDILLAIAVFVDGAKGHSALQLSRDLDCQYRTAYVLAHKIREALADQRRDETVSGAVEVDGMYTGGYIKPANHKENRRDRRLGINQNGKRRVVVVMRQRGGATLPFVVKSEDAALPTLTKRIVAGSIVYADEAASWDLLHTKFLTKRINHSKAYSDGDACTNQAESFFSRLRRAEIGIHHHFSGPYLAAYAGEMSWREDSRRLSNGVQYLMATEAALKHPPSKLWRGYWNRSRIVAS